LNTVNIGCLLMTCLTLEEFVRTGSDVLKVAMGYYAYPKRLVNMRELKFNYGTMKAHDCHVIMTQLHPIALRGILPQRSAPQS
jgi:hypothetical protein